MYQQRYVKAEFAAWLGIVGNFALAILKGIVGWAANSKALIADAVHSASVAAGSFAELVGIRASRRPLGEDIPYKRGKTEPLAAIIVSVLLIIVGVEFGISALKSIKNGITAPPHWAALVPIVISIIVKEAMFRYQYILGQKLSSQTLIANAWGHRSDVYSSVIALMGIAGAIAGRWLGRPELYYLDPIAGLLVSALVIHLGYKMIVESVHSTLDHALHEEEAAELISTVQRVDGVITVDDLRAREHGHYVVVEVKISVNPRISVAEGHDIAKTAKNLLMKRFIHVSDVFIHVNPYDPGYPYKNNVNPDHNDFPNLLH